MNNLAEIVAFYKHGETHDEKSHGRRKSKTAAAPKPPQGPGGHTKLVNPWSGDPLGLDEMGDLIEGFASRHPASMELVAKKIGGGIPKRIVGSDNAAGNNARQGAIDLVNDKFAFECKGISAIATYRKTTITNAAAERKTAAAAEMKKQGAILFGVVSADTREIYFYAFTKGFYSPNSKPTSTSQTFTVLGGNQKLGEVNAVPYVGRVSFNKRDWDSAYSVVLDRKNASKAKKRKPADVQKLDPFVEFLKAIDLDSDAKPINPGDTVLEVVDDPKHESGFRVLIYEAQGDD